MGWFDGLWSSGSGSDPLAKLDPKLRQFLEKESPIKYQTAAAARAQLESEKAAERLRQSTEAEAGRPGAAGGADEKRVPPQSLFQDGRYAYLWKTYRPLAEVEAENKTDHERLMDVLDAYKDRRAQIGRAALENCALEQHEWNTCIRTGSVMSRLTMCHAEMKKFERCYNMQSRLLKALGYLSTYERPPEEDERIQVHADALYHRMLEQEAVVEQAKAEGREVPALSMDVGIPGIRQLERPAAASESLPSSPYPPISTDLSDIPEPMRKDWAEKLAKLPVTERLAEEAAMRAELRAHTEMAGRVAELRAAQAAEREQRKAEGRSTFKDRVSGLISWK